ncbi:unnamed protein product [Hapterophycus canaliculatus]
MQTFSLDVNRGELVLTFNEAMSDATEDTDWTGVSLRTHVNGLEGVGVTLWNTQGEPGWGGTASTNTGLTLSVDLHPIDLDEMKAAYIGHNSSFTWLTLRRGAFSALDGGGGNEPVYGTQVVGHNGLSVSELDEDTTSPTLDRFTLGTTNREVVLFFSEGVAAVSALEPSALTLSPSRSDSGPLSSPGVSSASLLCSSVELGRRQGSSNSASRREIVLRLDEPCAITASAANATGATNASSSTLSATNGTDTTAASTFVGGYDNDWSKLVATGLVIADGEDAWLGVPLLLNATSDLVTDLSAAANPVVAVMNLAQSLPDCQPCGNGTYRSEPCTEVFDAVCTPCTEACTGGDQFVLSPCTAETDLDCHRCTPCTFGTREVGECLQTADRLCEACTECGEGEYESRGCRTSGEDRICETCLRCSMSPEVAEACRDSRLVWRWQMDNCCETEDGEKFPCVDVALENLRISAREGRRHWLYWGRGQPARDGVTPRDRLIEVEFRAGAETVFDDPRYVGQEGPTGDGNTGAL